MYRFCPAYRAIALVLLVLVTLGGVSCVRTHRRPNLERIFEPARRSEGKTPVIVIPGALGSQLVDPTTGKVVWPSADISKQDDLDLPISTNLEENTDRLLAARIVDTTKLSILLPEIRVYRDLLRALESVAGYRPGSMDLPPPNGDRDTFYVFSYDWRRDNVENARLLARKIDALKTELGRPDLRFNILAHSMGGLIARYYAMYGDRNLDALPADGADWRGAANINRLLLIGTPNRGVMDALRSLNEGYNYYGGNVKRSSLFNKLDAELLLSLPSVYQLLPFAGEASVINERLERVPIDLLSIDTWRANAWSIFSEKHRKRVIKRLGSTAGNARLAEEEAFLDAALKRARAFQESLERRPAIARTIPIYIFGGDCELTLEAPLVVQGDRVPRTYFLARGVRAGRTVLDKKRLLAAMFAPGDGRVTRGSLIAETRRSAGGAPMKSDLGFDHVVFGCQEHGELPNNVETQNNILSVIVNDVSAETAER